MSNTANSDSENDGKSPKEKESRKRKKGIDLNEIYQKSNGVTCHRSAHVGITMSGKMRRLQEQDEQFKKTKLDAKKLTFEDEFWFKKMEFRFKNEI